jgi:hypothetical protein
MYPAVSPYLEAGILPLSYSSVMILPVSDNPNPDTLLFYSMSQTLIVSQNLQRVTDPRKLLKIH